MPIAAPNIIIHVQPMRTAIIIISGILLLGACLIIARMTGGNETMPTAAKVFVAIWLLAAGANMWMGVAKDRYAFAEELPIFLVIFALPAGTAALIWWKFS